MQKLRKIHMMSAVFVLFLMITIPSIATLTSINNVCEACNCPPPPCPPSCPCEPGSVHYLGKDALTHGNWTNAVGSPIGKYGSYAHILPNPPRNWTEIIAGNFSVPVSPFTYADYGWTSWPQGQIDGLPFNRTSPPYWDEYVTLAPPVTYYLNGTLFYDSILHSWIQYPAFEWAWDDFNSSDSRAAYFTIHTDGGGPGTRLTCWDDGSERGFPSNGYFNVTLTFPDGVFMLSLYAYDKEQTARDNQTITITDKAGDILASGIMQGAEFNEGVYLQFIVCGPTTIVVQVMKSPESINALLSGIFVDKLTCTSKTRYTKTTCFWKTNIAKLLGYQYGKPDINMADMLNYIGKAADRCPDIFGNLASLSGKDRLKAAYQILTYNSWMALQAAKAQLFALLLNVASGKASETDIVAIYLYSKLHYKYPKLGQFDYPLTLKMVIGLACSNIMLSKNLQFTRDICETLNNGYTAIVLS